MSEVTRTDDETGESTTESDDSIPESDDSTAESDASTTDAPELPACLCPVGDVLDRLSKKYAIQIVCAVGVLEPVRYRELSDQLGDVSSSTLSTRLEELVDADILAREQYDEIPPRVEYRLTDEGQELAERLEPVVEWAQER